MGSFLDRYLQTDSTTAPAPSAPVFDSAKYMIEQEQEPAEKQPSAWDMPGNILGNLAKLLVVAGTPYELSPGLHDELAAAQAKATGIKGLGRSAWAALQDIAVMAQPMGALREGIGVPSEGEVTLGGLVAGVPTGLLQIAGAPIETVLGVGLDKPEFYALTDEERERAIKETAANIVALAATAGTSIALKGGAITTGRKALAEAAKGSVADIVDVANKASRGAWGRALAHGTLEAGVGGTAYTAIASAGDPDWLKQVLINGVLFAPLGAAFELVRVAKNRGQDIVGRTLAADAADLAQLRQIQVTTGDSFAGIAAKLDGLDTAEDLGEAVLRGKLKSADDRPFVVPGISPHALSRYTKLLAEGEVTRVPQFFLREDGLYDMAVTGRGVREVKLFRETGFLVDEIVSINGKDALVKSVGKDGKVWVQTIGAKKARKVERADVRRNPDQEKLVVRRQLAQDFAQYFAKQETAAKPTSSPIGMDEAVQQMLDATPSGEFHEVLARYAKDRGFSDVELPRLEADLTAELMKLIEADELELSPAQLDRLREVQNEPSLIDIRRGQAEVNSATLSRLALSNGMYVDADVAGSFVLRDLASNRKLRAFSQTKDAIEFINKSGQERGPNLLGRAGTGLPKRFASDIMPIPEDAPRPNESPYMILKGKLGTEINDLVNIKTDWATPQRSVFTALDNKYKTQLFAGFFDRLQQARLRFEAALRPDIAPLYEIAKMDLTATPAVLEKIGGWLETASPAELELHGGIGGKALNDLEVTIGRGLAKDKIDIQRVVKYTRLDKKIRETFEVGSPEYIDAKEKLDTEYGFDDRHKAAVDVIDGVRSGSAANLGAITRYVLALEAKADGTGGFTRAEYEAHHKMKPVHVKMGQALADHWDTLAGKYGIDPNHKIWNYMTHARLFEKGEFRAAWNDLKLPQEVKDFYAKLHRTGELDAYEKNPLIAQLRYIRAFHSSNHFQPALQEVSAALPKEIAKLPKQMQEQVMGVAKRYISDIQGFPGAAREATQQLLDEFFQARGFPVAPDVRHQIVNFILLTGDAAYQGFRLHAGIRDFYGISALYDARFGKGALMRAYAYGIGGLDGITRKDLAQAGVIPELDVITIDSPGDFAQTVIGQATSAVQRKVRGVAETAFRFSGQKDVYSFLAAGAYLERWQTAGKALTDLARASNPEAKAKAYRKLKIDTYEPAVVAEFDRLVTNNQFEAAARFIARQTVYEQVGVYGRGNGPGWTNRNVGRIAGQYGSWPMWLRTTLSQQLTRGTYRQRLGYIARLAASQSALAIASVATGLSLSSWYVPKGLSFLGGPAVSAIQDVNDAIGGYGIEQQLAQYRIASWLPYNVLTGEWEIGHAYIPGSYFANDLAEAYLAAQEGHPMAPLRALGFRLKPQE